mgnify:CR=1 FL=1
MFIPIWVLAIAVGSFLTCVWRLRAENFSLSVTWHVRCDFTLEYPREFAKAYSVIEPAYRTESLRIKLTNRKTVPRAGEQITVPWIYINGDGTKQSAHLNLDVGSTLHDERAVSIVCMPKSVSVSIKTKEDLAIIQKEVTLIGWQCFRTKPWLFHIEEFERLHKEFPFLSNATK